MSEESQSRQAILQERRLQKWSRHLWRVFSNGKHQLLLAHALRVFNFKAGGHFKEGGYVECFKFGEMHVGKLG